ncbi:MAG: M1 family peptidase [Planctomycetota bacterium]|nr:MAG: M1 family peptidase [Planctomycetota bacterium]
MPTRRWPAARLAARVLLGLSGLAALPAQVPGEGFHLPDRLPAQSLRNANYRIHAELADDGATIEGRLVADWRNPTEEPAGELLWHVYNNAWAGPESFFLRRQALLGGSGRPRSWGGTEIRSVRLLGEDGEPDRELSLAWRPPEEAPGDRTVLATPLPAPVPGGGRVRVEVVFRAVLPPAFRRSGTDGAGGYVHAAQWFPKLGVFEERDGRTAWTCPPYQPLTEFYSDYGVYEVELVLPARYRGRVAATGSVLAEEDGPGPDRFTLRLRAEDVHDFAWTADPDFLVVEQEFDPAEWADPAEEQRVAAALGRPVEAIRPRPTRILLFLQPEHEELGPRYLEAACRALRDFQLWFGPYPYETLSIVDPAHAARATGGMEYPRLITGGARLGGHPRSLSPESVTVHEFGHQYWYGLCGNNEFDHAWLDEGLNSWSQARVLARGWKPSLATYRLLGRERAGAAPVEFPAFPAHDPRALLLLDRWDSPDLRFLPPLGLDLRHPTGLERWLAELPPLSFWPEVVQDPFLRRRRALARDWSDPLLRPTRELIDREMMRTNAYDRPVLVLETLARLIGDTRMTRVMRAFAEEYRFRHPRPEDFFAVVRRYGAGAEYGGGRLDLDGFLRQAFVENRSLDFGIRRLEALPAADGPAAEGSPRWDVVLELRRYGDFVLPVEYRLIWEDGESEDGVWDGRDPWLRLRWTASARRPRAAILDPNDRLLLDRSEENDTRRLEPDRSRTLAAGLRAWIWAEQVLHHAGGRG